MLAGDVIIKDASLSTPMTDAEWWCGYSDHFVTMFVCICMWVCTLAR